MDYDGIELTRKNKLLEIEKKRLERDFEMNLERDKVYSENPIRSQSLVYRCPKALNEKRSIIKKQLLELDKKRLELEFDLKYL